MLPVRIELTASPLPRLWADNRLVATPTVFGFAGHDVLVGTQGRDVFDGLGGDDTISGGIGGDTFVWGQGSGNDVIETNSSLTVWTIDGAVDLVKLIGLNPDDVYANLLEGIYIKSTGERLSFLGAGMWEIEQFLFADGTMWSPSDFLANGRFIGGDLADTLSLNAGSLLPAVTVIEGRGGADIITGALVSTAATVYLWSLGDGNDVIDGRGVATASDRLELKATNPADVALLRVGDDLTVSVAPTGEVITIVGHFRGAGVGEITFEDGTVWTSTKVLNFVGSNAAETIFGQRSGETINKRIQANDCDDTVYAGLGDDVVIGGHGADLLSGDSGADTYLWRKGDGNDRITYAGGGLDRLILGDVLRTGATVVPRIDVASGNRLLLDITITETGEIITVEAAASGFFGVRTIVFSDGTEFDTRADVTLPELAPVVIDDFGYQVAVGQTLVIDPQVLLANDVDPNGQPLSLVSLTVLEGGTILQQAGGTYLFTPAADYFGQASLSYTVSDGVSQSTATVWIDVFGVPTTGDDTLYGTSAVNSISALAGDDQIFSLDGSDILNGGAGDDTLNGGSGADSYVYARGDGNDIIYDDATSGESAGSSSDIDVLVLNGLLPTDIVLERRNNADLIIKIPTESRAIWVNGFIRAVQDGGDEGIEEIRFQDGTIWNRAAIFAHVTGVDVGRGTNESDFIEAGSSADVIDGWGGHDYIETNGGNDTITGNTGNDALWGGGGEDRYIYRLGDGNDTIHDAGLISESDTLDLRDLLPAQVRVLRDGNHLFIEVIETGAMIRVDNHFATDGRGLDQVQFSNGLIWDRAAIQSNLVGGTNTAPSAPSAGIATSLEDGTTGTVTIGAADPDGDALVYSVKTGAEPTKGVVAFDAAAGTFTYTPNANVNGTDTFTIVVSDGRGGTVEQVVTVTITPVNDAPTVAATAAITTLEDVASGAIAIGATDLDGDTLSYSVKVDAAPTKGSVAFDAAAGTFVYTPNANAHGTDTFTIVVSDGRGGTAEQVVTVSIAPVNDAPTVSATAAITTLEDVASGAIAIGATDLDGDTLTYSVKVDAAPTKGTVSFDATAGTFVYTPAANANGSDTFTIVISDGSATTPMLLTPPAMSSPRLQRPEPIPS